MRFWDASAIVPLLIHQEWSSRARSILEEDTDIVAWWGSPIECASAIARLRREGVLSSSDEAAALRELEGLRSTWHEILAGEQLRAHALRILRLHPIRSADALQLAAAVDWAGTLAAGAFVSFDQRLATAAELEGFRVVGL